MYAEAPLSVHSWRGGCQWSDDSDRPKWEGKVTKGVREEAKWCFVERERAEAVRAEPNKS